MKRPPFKSATGAKVLFLLLIFSFYITTSFSQQKISGLIRDIDTLPVAGATILIKHSSVGTQTASDGTFSIVAKPGDVLLISFVGMKRRSVTVGGETFITVTLAPDDNSLEDVTVIGYGTSRKKDLTGAISTVSSKDFNPGILTSPDQLIQGKVAGLQISYNNGQPGGAANIKIRGNSALSGTGQPLYVIDGVPLDGRSLQAGNNPLNFINPNDIASMDVLKDASATAIYGSRAAYGVIIINTKRAHSGQPKIDLKISAGVASVLKKIKVLNAAQFKDAISYYNVNQLNDKGGNEDALGAILQNGFQQDYSLAISGGNENGKYRVSAILLDQDGIVKNTDFKKYGIDLSTNFKFLESKKLGLDLNVISSQYIQKVPQSIEGASGIIVSALQWNPTDSLRNADGSLKIISGGYVNPVSLTELISNKLKVTTILGSISPHYKFTDWLEYKLLLSINYSSGISRSSVNELLRPEGRWGTAGIGSSELTTRLITQTLNFNKEIFTDLNLTAVAGFEYMRFTMKGFSMSGVGVEGTGFGNFGLDYTNYIQYSSTDSRGISSFAEPNSELQSFFGRTIFNYKDKYLLTATFRADGSSKFGENNKYGYFPSFAGAWNIHEEDFFNLPFVNSLKIRAGWGITGNQEFPAGSAQAKYSFLDNGALRQANNPNPNLQWQSDRQYNIGVDFSMFNNRISGTLDFFNKTTTNLLFPSLPLQPAPPLSTIRWINLDGKIINKGLEALVNAAVVRNETFKFDISVNGTFLNNNVSDMPTTISTGWLHGSGVSGTSVEVIENGHPMNTFYTRKFTGMDKDSGLSVYQDHGVTFYHLGDPNPKALLGMNLTFRYKKFSLITNLYGAFGQDIFYNTLMNVINVAGIHTGKNIAFSIYEDPVKESYANPITPSSRFIIKGDYLKMTNMTLGYTLSEKAKTFKGANIFVTGQNLFIITKYPGFDPESNFDGSNNGIPSLGIDYAQYPSSRTLILGINLSL